MVQKGLKNPFLGTLQVHWRFFGKKDVFAKTQKTTAGSLLANLGEKVRVGTGTFAIFRRNVAAYEVSKKFTFVRRDFRGKSKVFNF